MIRRLALRLGLWIMALGGSLAALGGSLTLWAVSPRERL